MIPIVKTGNSILITRASEVRKFDKKLIKLIDEMKDTLNNTYDPVGVGLAAPQVGISQRIFLAKPFEKSKISVFINPQIIDSNVESEIKTTKNANSKKRLLEGCLSIPNIWGNVKRKKEVNLIFQNEKGKKYQKVFKGFMATIIQHETDHLDGILFTKHVLEQGEKLYKSYKNEEGEDEFEEIKL